MKESEGKEVRMIVINQIIQLLEAQDPALKWLMEGKMAHNNTKIKIEILNQIYKPQNHLLNLLKVDRNLLMVILI